MRLVSLNGWLALLLALCLAACDRAPAPPAADFTLPDGSTGEYAQFHGQWLVINYWAEWCGPCRKEVPELNRLAEELQAQPVRVLGVNFDVLQGEELNQAIAAVGIR